MQPYDNELIEPFINFFVGNLKTNSNKLNSSSVDKYLKLNSTLAHTSDRSPKRIGYIKAKECNYRAKIRAYVHK